MATIVAGKSHLAHGSLPILWRAPVQKRFAREANLGYFERAFLLRVDFTHDTCATFPYLAFRQRNMLGITNSKYSYRDLLMLLHQVA